MDSGHLPGRVTITARAYERVAVAVIAEELGVGPRHSRATVRDAKGAISVEITSAVALGEAALAPRALAARTRTTERLAEMTGARVADVHLRVNQTIDHERRVR